MLSENGFRLANLDYEGSGVQQSYFVPHHRKYGILTGTEAVFLRSNEYYIGKLYPNGIEFYEKYKWDLDDLIGPNFVMVKKSRKDLYDLLSIKS